MSTVSTDSKRDKIRQVETFPQPRNEKRQLPKPPARGSPLPSAWKRRGRLRRGWERKAAIKPCLPWLKHPSPGSCTSSQLACTIPNSVPGPWVGVLRMLSVPGLRFSLLQTARGKGEQDETRIAQIPQLITAASKGERSKLQCVTGLVSWLQESTALAQLLPTLFDPGNTQAASNTSFCSLANPYPKSISTQVHHSCHDCNV